MQRVPISNGVHFPTRTVWRRVWTDVELAIIFEPRDLWSGWYWDKRAQSIIASMEKPITDRKVKKGDKATYTHHHHTSISVYSLYRSLLPTLVLRLRWHDRRSIRHWATSNGWTFND